MLVESPSWLELKGRHEEAQQVAQKLLASNELPLPKGEDPAMTNDVEVKARDTWMDVIRSRTLLLNTLLCCFGW